MNHQDRILLKEVYGLNYKECSSVFNMVRTGSYTLDSAAKKILNNRKGK